MISVRPAEFSVSMLLLLPKYVNQIAELTIQHSLSAYCKVAKNGVRTVY